MAEKRKASLPKTEGMSADAALDALNTALRSKRNSPVSIRRRMEATIEEKSRKRGKEAGPVSSAWKPQG